MQREETIFGNAGNRLKRFTAEYSHYGESDYENLWEDFDRDFDREFSENNEESSPNVVLLCVFITLLSVIFLASITINVSILMVFARKQTLRTTSNRFIINLLVVNILSSCMFLPLVMLDLLVSPSPSSSLEHDSVSVMAQCVLSVTVSQWIAGLSMLSTLAIAVDQYLAILHALRYHHHMTRLRSSLSLGSVWVLSCVTALSSTCLLTVPARETALLWSCCAAAHLPSDKHEVTNMAISIVIVITIFLIPSLLLTVIYSKIFMEAHNSSERTRRNSINPNENVFNITSTVLAPLNISQSDLRKLQKLTRNNSRSKPPSLPTGRLRRSSTNATIHKSEPMLQRQNSLISRSPSFKANLGSLRHRISNASQLIHREEGRTAKVYIISLAMLLFCWSPFYISYLLQSIRVGNSARTPRWIYPLIFSVSLLYAALSPFIFAYRNTKIKRELFKMFSIKEDHSDLASLPPLPPTTSSRRIYRSVSMKESSRAKKRERQLRNSFLVELSGKSLNKDSFKRTSRHPGYNQASLECETLLLTISSSTDTSARSSFSSASTGNTRHSSIHEERLEATC
eukprot:TRINITY_DN16931_c0_g1_i1.p1 TRINITY_DN16931_c0_g1~~TRINITY_DN16931_c0_g1_i1.p1  ORF type:complete len:570 (-),score=92.77 TRINITY_DN16931_c0_g1_i1:183-1892(-)